MSCKFGVNNAVAWRSVYRVVWALNLYRNAFIVWMTADESIATANRIEGIFGYPGVTGFVDATAIEMALPLGNPHGWINRKRYASMKLQVKSKLCILSKSKRNK